MGDVPSTPEEARARLGALGLGDDGVQTLFAHFDDAERRGKHGHGFARIPWLETQRLDGTARPAKVASEPGLDRWEGQGALGYLTLQAICDDLIAQPPALCPRRCRRRLLPDRSARILGADARRAGGPRRRSDRHLPGATRPPGRGDRR